MIVNRDWQFQRPLRQGTSFRTGGSTLSNDAALTSCSQIFRIGLALERLDTGSYWQLEHIARDTNVFLALLLAKTFQRYSLVEFYGILRTTILETGNRSCKGLNLSCCCFGSQSNQGVYSSLRACLPACRLP
jgi:hypothetical protein